MQSGVVLLRFSPQLRLATGAARVGRARPRRCHTAATAKIQPTLLEVFTAVREGRLSPLDAAQTVEESIVHEVALPRVINGHGKRPEAIARQMESLMEQQECVLVTGIEPMDYATIRKTVPGVKYHAGAKTLQAEERGTLAKLPGSVAIVTDMSVQAAAVEELKVVADFLGCYTFQLDPLSVTHLSDVIQQMKSVSHAHVVLVVYNEEPALPDVIAGLSDAPVISVCVGEQGSMSHPSLTMISSNLVNAAYSAAKILKSVERILSMQTVHQQSPPLDNEDVSQDSAEEQVHSALGLLNGEVSNYKKKLHRVNNVVTSDVRETSGKLPSDAVL